MWAPIHFQQAQIFFSLLQFWTHFSVSRTPVLHCCLYTGTTKAVQWETITFGDTRLPSRVIVPPIFQVAGIVGLVRDMLYVWCQKVPMRWNVFGNFTKRPRLEPILVYPYAGHSTHNYGKRRKMDSSWGDDDNVECLSSTHTQGLNRHPHMTGIFSHVTFLIGINTGKCPKVVSWSISDLKTDF